MISKNRRIDPKLTEKREELLKKCGEAIEKSESILTKKDSVMWEEIQFIVGEMVKEKDYKLLEFEKMDARAIDICLAEKRELETLFNLFDTIETNLTKLYESKGKLEQELRDRKKDQPNS